MQQLLGVVPAIMLILWTCYHYLGGISVAQTLSNLEHTLDNQAEHAFLHRGCISAQADSAQTVNHWDLSQVHVNLFSLLFQMLSWACSRSHTNH